MRAAFAIVVVSVGVGTSMVGGCGSDEWKPTLSPVDSGGGAATTIFTDLVNYNVSGPALRVPKLTWTADGSALLVAGPAVTSSSTQSSLWSVALTSRAVTTPFTAQGSDRFSAVSCYAGTTACDISYASGRVLRRAANGDTATLLASTQNGFYVSENGRYFLFAESDAKMRVLDATTGVKTMQASLPDLTKFLVRVAISNDGAEVDVVAAGGLSVTRYNLAGGSTSTWSMPAEPGMSGSVEQLKRAGTTLYALGHWTSATAEKYIQYPVIAGPPVTLGTMPKFIGGGAAAWRPEAGRLVVEVVSAQETSPPGTLEPFTITQLELMLLRGGTATRVARSGFGWLNMALSPDGRMLGYGLNAISLKDLPL